MLQLKGLQKLGTQGWQNLVLTNLWSTNTFQLEVNMKLQMNNLW